MVRIIDVPTSTQARVHLVVLQHRAAVRLAAVVAGCLVAVSLGVWFLVGDLVDSGCSGRGFEPRKRAPVLGMLIPCAAEPETDGTGVIKGGHGPNRFHLRSYKLPDDMDLAEVRDWFEGKEIPGRAWRDWVWCRKEVGRFAPSFPYVSYLWRNEAGTRTLSVSILRNHNDLSASYGRPEIEIATNARPPSCSAGGDPAPRQTSV